MPPVNMSLVLKQRNKNKKKLKMIHYTTAFDINHDYTTYPKAWYIKVPLTV